MGQHSQLLFDVGLGLPVSRIKRMCPTSVVFRENEKTHQREHYSHLYPNLLREVSKFTSIGYSKNVLSNMSPLHFAEARSKINQFIKLSKEITQKTILKTKQGQTFVYPRLKYHYNLFINSPL